jgi:hypothetical protein
MPLTPQPTPATKPVPTQPREPTVDQVLEALEHLQAQKAELEKQEQSLKAVLAKKLEQQGERVKKVGLKKDEPKQMPETRVEDPLNPDRDRKVEVAPPTPLPKR